MTGDWYYSMPMKENNDNGTGSGSFHFKAAAMGVAILACVSSFIYQFAYSSSWKEESDWGGLGTLGIEPEKKKELSEDWNKLKKSIEEIREIQKNN
ncbi:MAG: hypothetical protein G01um101418_427 [Parcubacteria group bacterium Gr01-1014_18]|nr:MAG: hypothetical protein Greene041636_472 [Parcubacteria group bacterium Greene0416_36]TSC81014.1 MAG: hypothetical protein G01um101418_427 [Parcubacteria group bacterium Gr01-1014_18]TSC98936.1 MAG: hypothetical protein Greene101420_448 [Parcubacteria group bacterium Greene1014_20]TSD06772.1 MAG: hypothetical protein Greene07142_693 [Parcubacteria group bacterium Greene0714_2]